jgi:predicted transcriptional regulator
MKQESQLPKPTDSELEILQHLWAHGPSTVRDVNDALNKEKEVGYTTTLKLMQIMAEKGLVHRTLDGKTHIYEAAVTQENTQQLMLDRVMNSVFGGSMSRLVMQALGGTHATAAELAQIREMLDKLEGDKK